MSSEVVFISSSGWRRVGPWRSGARHTGVIGAATGKPCEHVRVTRRQDPLFESGALPCAPTKTGGMNPAPTLNPFFQAGADEAERPFGAFGDIAVLAAECDEGFQVVQLV